MLGTIAVDVINKRKLIGLLDFNYTVIGGNVDRLSCQVCSLQRPEDQKLENVNENNENTVLFPNVFAIILFKKRTADELTVFHKNA